MAHLFSPSCTPRVIAFDLDATLWTPEMYELWGGGAPFRKGPNGTLRDRQGTTVQLMGVSREVLRALKREAEWSETIVAFVSRCDEPSWARECMHRFVLDDGGLTMADVVDIEIIRKQNKRKMFEQIEAETGVPFYEMIFYDNERGNCVDVAPLGVRCVYTPEGLTENAWNASLRAYEAVSAGAADDADGEVGDDRAWEGALRELGETSGAARSFRRSR